MTYYLDPSKNTYEYNLSVAHDMCAAEQFATKQAHKDCLTRIQRAYECLREKRDLKALEAAGYNWFDIPMELRHCRHEKHFDLLCAALGNDAAGRVFYLQREQQRIKAMPIVKPTPKPKAPARTTERQATHAGSCQICGRKHKLDVKTGRIAAHGYTLEHGWQNGVCIGSHNLPYERSANKLVWFVSHLEGMLQRNNDRYATAMEKHGLTPQVAQLGVDLDNIKRNLNAVKKRIEAFKPNQPLTPVEELV
jgi:hypothetical protein